ncbi:MAG: sulfotransferase [Gammaproteobacteria bacterium]|nr:sulfotransferase [Gammaproteobacteria bacterium]
MLKVRVLHHMARSGGTVIAKCLGCMSGVILLSETHPYGGQYFNPLKQAHHWFDLFTPDDIAAFKRGGTMDFAEAIMLIAERCSSRGEKLAIRDWTHLDFTAVPFLPEPTYRLTTADVLREHCNVIQAATTRHPIDQWLSLRKLALIQGRLSLDEYLVGYRRFAEKCVEIGFIRYEDFARTPELMTQELCRRLEVEYDRDFIDKWVTYDKVTGDVVSARAGGKIGVLPRRPMEPGLLERFEGNGDYQKALMLLGYRHPG